MKKELIYPFLIRMVIPEAKTLPEGWDKTNLIWDAVWRAHRDTNQGRYQFGNYSGAKVEKGRIPTNSPSVVLYEFIIKGPSPAELSSKYLIDQLLERFPGVRFGAIQKLVNMTLKYLTILQTFSISDDEILAKLPTIDATLCDCPLDSTILRELGFGFSTKWTDISQDEYQKVQKKAYKNSRVDSGLIYDFKNYQHLG